MQKGSQDYSSRDPFFRFGFRRIRTCSHVLEHDPEVFRGFVQVVGIDRTAAQYGYSTRMAWFLQHQGKACFSYIDGHASLILRNELPADNTFPFYKFSP